MGFSALLKSKYEKADLQTRQLFDSLIFESSKYCTDHISVDMKEFHYRLQKKYVGGKGRKYQNFCLYTLMPTKKGVTVHLRTEGNEVLSEKIDICRIGECSYLRGKGWVRFTVKTEDDLKETVRLIKQIYEET